MSSASDDLAQTALSEQEGQDEIANSQKVAETINALQGVIERNALELQELAKKIKLKREMMKSTLDQNQGLAEAEEKVKAVATELKEQKSKVANDPAMVSLKLELAELAQNKREIEETLSSHLVNYHQLTGSTSFDTSDGDQWEFKISARVKNH
jgi:hypothetical protein